MKRKLKHTSKLYQFLEQKGVLANGTDAEILAAKQEYRRLYQANWRRSRRKADTELTVTLTARELQILTVAAQKHHRAKSRFLKEAALAYTTKSFVVPDVFTTNAILEYLTLAYTEIQKLFDENKMSYQVGTEALQRIATLETEVTKALHQPQCLEDRIIEAIRKNLRYKETLHHLLQQT